MVPLSPDLSAPSASSAPVAFSFAKVAKPSNDPPFLDPSPLRGSKSVSETFRRGLAPGKMHKEIHDVSQIISSPLLHLPMTPETPSSTFSPNRSQSSPLAPFTPLSHSGALGETLVSDMDVDELDESNPHKSLSASEMKMKTSPANRPRPTMLQERISRMKKQIDNPVSSNSSSSQRFILETNNTAIRSLLDNKRFTSSMPTQLSNKSMSSSPLKSPEHSMPVMPILEPTSHSSAASPEPKPLISRSLSFLEHRPTSLRGPKPIRALPNVFAEALESAERWNHENQEMRVRISELETQVSSMEQERDRLGKEHEDISKRLILAKQTGIEGVKRASASMESMQTELTELNQAYANSTVDFNSMMAEDLSSLKSQSAKALDLIQSFFNAEDSYNFKASETREIINTLQNEMHQLTVESDKKQQVIILLRERLETVTGELLEQKDRAVAHDAQQIRNAQELQHLTTLISRTAEYAEHFEASQKETLNALVQAGEFESKFKAAQARFESVDKEFEMYRQKSELDKAELLVKLDTALETSIKHEINLFSVQKQLSVQEATNAVLQIQHESLIADLAKDRVRLENLSHLEADIRQLRPMEAEASSVPALRERIEELVELNAKLSASVNALEGQKTEIERLRGVELNMLTLTETAADLKARAYDLDACLVSEREARAKAEGQRDGVEARLSQLYEEKHLHEEEQSQKINKAQCEVELLNQRIQLQEACFEKDRSELSSNFLAAEVKYQMKEEELSALQISLDKRCQMESTILDLRARNEAIEFERTEVQMELARATTELELVGRVVKHFEDAETTLHTEINSLRAFYQGSSQYGSELLEAVKSFITDKGAFIEKQEDHERGLRTIIGDLQGRLDSAAASFNERTREATEKIVRLEEHVSNATARIKSFADRYQNGAELSEDECIVVQEIMRQCQRSVEQQLVVKGNDIRRRDVIIKALEGRVKSLETLLAKQLDSKAKADATAGVPSRSLIDLNNWMSSSPHVAEHTHLKEVPDSVDSTTESSAAGPISGLVHQPTTSARVKFGSLDGVSSDDTIMRAAVDGNSKPVESKSVIEVLQNLPQSTKRPREQVKKASSELPTTSKRARMATRGTTNISSIPVTSAVTSRVTHPRMQLTTNNSQEEPVKSKPGRKKR